VDIWDRVWKEEEEDGKEDSIEVVDHRSPSEARDK